MKKTIVQPNPVDRMIERVAQANKYPSNSRLESRDRISIERRGWGGYWMLYATTENGTWSDDRRRYTHNPEGKINILSYATDPHIAIDPVARTWTLRGCPWSSMHKYFNWGGLYPGHAKFRYADKWNTSGYDMRIDGKMYNLDRNNKELLVVTYHRNGTVRKVTGPRTRLYIPSDEGRAYAAELRKKLRALLRPMDAMRVAGSSTDHPVFGTQALREVVYGATAYTPGMRAEQVMLDLRKNKYSYELHQNVLVYANVWRPDLEVGIYSLVRTLVRAKFAVEG